MRIENEIGANRLAADILCLTDKPSLKLLALNDRISRQAQKIVFVICISLIDIVPCLKCNSEDILIIHRPDGCIRADSHLVVKLTAVAINPLAGIPVLFGYGRNVVHAIV